MLVFGHVGLTLGAAAAVDYLYYRGKRPGHGTPIPSTMNVRDETGTTHVPFLKDHIDLRILLAGSLLPDIIDKPLGIYMLGNAIGNGRIFSHTLLFLSLCIIIGALVFWHWRRTWALVLAFGTFTHLIFDSMWNRPQTLFWPLLGAAFPKQDSANWIDSNIHNLLTKPSYYIPEIAGALVLLAFLLIVLRRRSLGRLIRKGKVS
jgi:membrane-bound metal-dependent hydrolase YbcI (DUF457 family)